MTMDKNLYCHCKSRKKYHDCCKPFLSGASTPKTPEELMRSRYSAFCEKNIEYLVSTHHPSKQKPDERHALENTINQAQWLGLKIISTEKTPDQLTGYVEFAAFYKDSEIRQFHERSKFIFENDQWYYLDGVFLEPVKLGRNELCWCGSSKKYKKCHGK